jgi:hypothetical protein
MPFGRNRWFTGDLTYKQQLQGGKMGYINLDYLPATNGRLFCPNCTKVSYVLHHSDRYAKEQDIVWLKKLSGPYGKFAGCPNFPKCKYSVSLEKKVVNIDFDDELRPY